MRLPSETSSAFDPEAKAETQGATEISVLPPEISLIRNGASVENSTSAAYINGGSEQMQPSVPDIFMRAPKLPTPRESFIALAKWRGLVVEVNGQTFRAMLSSVAGDEPQKEAEIYIEDIDLEDRHLVKKGAAFHWSVGYLDRPSGRIRASILRFSRAPRWSSRDIDRAKAEAKSYASFFNGKST